ncbi:MAG: hypothetical protein ACK518_03460 [bacterium]|jgi:hypothetical protein
MKDPIKFIKNAYFTALDGVITYNGSTIPVYDEEADETGGDYYIIISTITDADLPNKGKFMNEVEVIIDVVSQNNWRVDLVKQIVDAITAKVLNTIIPSIGTTNLSGNADFQIVDVRKGSSQHIPILDTGTKKIVRRLTRFTQIIIEK